MDVVHERVAGIDISKADVKVCVRVGRARRVVRTFSTMTKDLLQMRDWLRELGISVVGMEATGAYWKPVYYLLEDEFDVQLLNARHVHNVPGRKTDVIDSDWICQMVRHGLIRASFVPPEPVRQLRDVARYRAVIVRERAAEEQRLEKLLEDAGIKLSVVVSDLLGKSSRSMLEAMIAGERDPEVLAGMALRRMKSKRPQLVEALTGRFAEHHAFLARAMLDRIDACTVIVDRLSEQIDAMMTPWRNQAELLTTIPGVGTRVAEVILSEISTNMSWFPTARHLASWAGVCPGNNESGGRQRSGRARPGNAWLQAALGDAALNIARNRTSYLSALYRRIASRRGKRRAIVAVQHSILVSVWHMLRADTPYQELGPDYFTTRHGAERKTRKLIGQLNDLGFTVTLNPLEAA
ncbi:IS110 family transposase [Micromonospora sp. NBC_00898]|uniref:IS110 family transposase n=1 Tax=Micromonospora sp. NBC_00898 TaxID=2975981 RepID=UPI003868770B|nr:IS110 family transposase [Micromonospora sp. NBC_00898]WSX88738.1 IS110 family transposase [Micromonospora sp. NBC_00898]